MGMNHPGEIEVLAEIAEPDAAVITHVGTAHIEHMKTREAIAEEKSALAAAVPTHGYCAMPAADDFFEYVSDRVSCELIPVGIEEGDVRAEAVEVIDGGRIRFVLRSEMNDSPEVLLPVRGLHMVNNALLAAAVSIREGITPNVIAEKLGQVELSGGRLQERSAGGVRFLDDSYNANPDSMKAALETLKISPAGGRRVAVLGFMGELGEHEREAHLSVGGAVVKAGVDALVTVGDQASLINEGASGIQESYHFVDHDAASQFLSTFLVEDDLVLVKGSRAAAMEKVINHFN
jgi:UDP-N-acetylmuramoyl-tripeptide--D-alanyl-D-alanine ligase